MIHTVRWPPNDRLRFLGRNGTGQCTGIELFHNAGVVFLRPFTSKNVPGNCEIAVPVTALSELTTALETLHRVHKIKPLRTKRKELS